MSGYPMIDALNATHPLTPREKVARAVYDTVTRFDGDTVGTHLGLSAMIDAAAPTVDDERRIVKSVCDDIADSVLTAVASGSGDHAELARAMERAKENAMALALTERAEFAEAELQRSTANMCEQFNRAEALLAENAALRASIGRHDRQVSGMLRARLAAETRATEAERKLAEAVGHMSWMRVFVPTVWDVTEERLSEIDAFLSKEAERG